MRLSDKLLFSSYSKANVFFSNCYLLIFCSKKFLHCWLKQYIANRKIISRNIVTDTVKRTFRNFNSCNFVQFSIFMQDNIEYLQVLVVQGRFCQLQINSPVMASFYIYKLKINAKLPKKTLSKWDTLIHHVSAVGCANLQSQSFVFNVLISCHGRFKATKKSRLHITWNYKY